MANPRTWNLRLNLDEFNALVASLFADGDRALALQGLALGMNAGPCPDNVPDSFRRGWAIGSGMRAEADEFRSAQADRGKASAAKRLERNGSAQPQKGPGSRTETEPPLEPPLEQWLEPPLEPNHNPQSTIQETTNDKQSPLAPKGGKRPRVIFSVEMFDHMIPQPLDGSSEFMEAWHEWMVSRHERGKPISERAASQQLKDLPTFGGLSGALASIRQSIANDWQGLFPPKSSIRPSGPPGKAPVKWTGFDQTNYSQSEQQCRKDSNGNYLL